MIKFVTKELTDFATWLGNKFPCDTDVIVTEVHSLSCYEMNRKGKPNKKCLFKNGLAVYLEGFNEIYIADPDLMKDMLGGDICEFKGFENYSMVDYLLETFAHEYRHHMQKYLENKIDEEDAESWCKNIYMKYKMEIQTR